MNTIITNTIFKVFIISLILAVSQTVSAARVLPEFSANYAIKKYGTKLAEAHYRLSHTESGYKFTQNTNLYGLAKFLGNDTVSAVSYIHQAGNTLLLQKHRYRQTGREKNKDEDINISWESDAKQTKGKINGVVRNEKINLETSAPVWEALSFQIPLMIEASKEIEEYRYNALIKGKIEAYNFVLTETKKIYFAKKEYQALHLTRTDPKRNRQLNIWLAPELYNLPLIIENYRDGKEHSKMQLERISFQNKKSLIGEASFEPLTEDDDDF